MNKELTNGERKDLVNFQKYRQAGGQKTFAEWEEIEKQLKVCRIIFDESEHWQGKTFQQFLVHIKQSHLVEKDAEIEVEKPQKMTKEICQYENYLLSGGSKSFQQWEEIINK